MRQREGEREIIYRSLGKIPKCRKGKQKERNRKHRAREKRREYEREIARGTQP